MCRLWMRRSRQHGLLSDDNRVLEAAVEGAADCIVSGDADLLDLGSFQGIPIMAPGEFAATVLGWGSGELQARHRL
jgi:hypothetical protein